VREHRREQAHVFQFTRIVQFLTQALADFLDRFRGIYSAVHGLEHAKQGLQLAEIGFDGARHVGVLQFAGERAAIMAGRAMHLAERGRCGRLVLESCELGFPSVAKLGAHATLYKGPAHGRRV
jgi:hypothetical protein